MKILISDREVASRATIQRAVNNHRGGLLVQDWIMHGYWTGLATRLD